MSNAHNRSYRCQNVFDALSGQRGCPGEELEGATALLILDQQMRDAATAVERAKRTLRWRSPGSAGGRRLDATNARIADLESAPPPHSTAAGKISQGGRRADRRAGADRDAAMTARTVIRGGDLGLKRHVARR